MNKVNGNHQSVDPYSLLPEVARENWRRYIEFGEPPDPIAQAIIRNNLLEAHYFLDTPEGLATIWKCMKFLVEFAPAACYGSQENYESWVQMQGMLNKEREVRHAQC